MTHNDDHEYVANPDAVRLQVTVAHAAAESRLTVPLAAPASVAEASRRLVFRRGPVLDDRTTRSAYWAGLLVYGLEWYGFDYDGIVDTTNACIANSVAAISSDARISFTRRQLELRSRLTVADQFCQCVKLAEIFVRGRRVRTFVEKKTPVGDVKARCIDWLEAYHGQLLSLGALARTKLANKAITDMAAVAEIIGVACRPYKQQTVKGSDE